MAELDRRRFLTLAGAAVLLGARAAKGPRRPEVHVEDFGARGDATHDDADALQAAHDHVRSRGGGVVRMGRGVFRTSRTLLWGSGISLIGAGPAVSVIRPVDVRGSAIAGDRRYSAAAPFRDATFEHFGIDGSAMSQRGYDTSRKGIFVQHLSHVVFRDLTIRDTVATGLGVDFLRDVLIDGVVVERCGRGYRPGAGGGAGIGIGTGAAAVERVTVRRCRATACGSHGILFERQSGMAHLPTGVRVLRCSVAGNGQHGIMDSGCRGLVVDDCTSTGNGKSGFACGQSELGVPGRGGEVRNSRFEANREHGAILAAAGDGSARGYRLVANRARANGRSGVQLDGLTARLSDVTVVDNELAGNGSEGIGVAGGAGAGGIVVRGNHLTGNGLADRGPGVRLAANVSNVEIEENWFSDHEDPPTQGAAVLVMPGATVRGGHVGGNHTAANPGGGVVLEGRMIAVRTRR